jgi:nucleoside-diphosphate-sugar epimerase
MIAQAATVSQTQQRRAAVRVFVLGASGYAGFYAALRLAQAGHSVVGLVRNPDQRRLNILRVHEIRLVVGDASDPASYRDELARSDVVIHAMLDKKNLRETDRTLFAAIKAAPPPNGRRRRFIYTTGCSIFGAVPGPVLDETATPNPEHPLSFRYDLEREALAIEGVGVTVVRPGFMYGNDGYNSVASDWFAMAGEGEPVFRGDRERGWSWVHIDDVAEGYRRVVEAEGGVEGEVFFVADDAEHPKTLDAMRACLNAAGCTDELRFEGPKKGDNISTWFNQNEFVTSAKARRVLGWSPRHPGILQAAPSAYASWKAAQS